MAYCSQNRLPMPHEMILLMPFSVRPIALDDKLCHHVNLDVLQEIYPRETVEQVLSDCHAWEKREKALTMVAIVYLVIALTLFPRLTVGGSLAPLGQRRTLPVARPPRGGGDRWSDLPTAAAIWRNPPAAGVSAPLASACHPHPPGGPLP